MFASTGSEGGAIIFHFLSRISMSFSNWKQLTYHNNMIISCTGGSRNMFTTNHNCSFSVDQLALAGSGGGAGGALISFGSAGMQTFV